MIHESLELCSKVESYILNHGLKNVNDYLKNLEIMKYNVNLDWFNIALIARNIEDTDIPVVNTVGGWIDVLGVDDLEVKINDETSGALLKPLFIERYQSITFVPQPFIYSRAIKGWTENISSKVSVFSGMNEIIKKSQYEKLKNQMNEDWQINCVNQYLNTFPFYRSIGKEERSFFQRSLLITFGKELEYIANNDDLDFSFLKTYKGDRILTYRRIVDCVCNFHRHVKYYLDEYFQKDAMLKELDINESSQLGTGYEIVQIMDAGKVVNWQRYKKGVER